MGAQSGHIIHWHYQPSLDGHWGWRRTFCHILLPQFPALGQRDWQSGVAVWSLAGSSPSLGLGLMAVPSDVSPSPYRGLCLQRYSHPSSGQRAEGAEGVFQQTLAT